MSHDPSHFARFGRGGFIRYACKFLDEFVRGDPSGNDLEWTLPLHHLGWEPPVRLAESTYVVAPIEVDVRSALTALTESPHV